MLPPGDDTFGRSRTSERSPGPSPPAPLFSPGNEVSDLSPQEGAIATDVGGSTGEAGEGAHTALRPTPSVASSATSPKLAALEGQGNEWRTSLVGVKRENPRPNTCLVYGL